MKTVIISDTILRPRSIGALMITAPESVPVPKRISCSKRFKIRRFSQDTLHTLHQYTPFFRQTYKARGSVESNNAVMRLECGKSLRHSGTRDASLSLCTDQTALLSNDFTKFETLRNRDKMKCLAWILSFISWDSYKSEIPFSDAYLMMLTFVTTAQ